MGACCFKSTAVPETSEGDTPQDELALNSLPTSETSNDPEQTSDEVKSKEDATKNEEEAKSSTESSITEPGPPLEQDNEEYLVVEDKKDEDKKDEDELKGELTIISPLPSPYQTYPFTVDEPESEPEQEPEPQVEEKSIEKPTKKEEKEEIPQEEMPQEEATALEVIAKDESLTRGELVLSSSLISYDIISEVDSKSLDARSKKVNVTKTSNGSNTNEEVAALEQPEEQKYTSFKKDTMSNKKNSEDKYKTEVVRIENEEFVSVEYK